MTEGTSVAPRRRRHRRWFGGEDPFDRMRDEMDRVFSHYLRPLHGPALDEDGERELALATSLDVSETDDAVEIVLDVPGVERDDIDISLSDGALTISGKREDRSETKEKNFHRVERSHGSFRRSLALPCDVEADKVEASLKKGVLTITLPKSIQAKENTRKIAITAD